MSRRAFTLTELIIVVVIIAILAAMAATGYAKTVERSYWREARDILLTVYAGEQVYFAAKNSYYAPTLPADWNKIHMDNPNTSSVPVTYTVTTSGGPPPTAFTATATRTGGGSMTIDQTRTLCTGAPCTWPMP